MSLAGELRERDERVHANAEDGVGRIIIRRRLCFFHVF